MKLEVLLFLMLAGGAAGAACGAEAGSSSTSGGGGSGGFAGQSGTGDATASGQTGVGTSGTGASSTSGGGGSGGFPANCVDTADCGNFGGGCIKCAAKSACAAPYQTCFEDASCKSYSLCIEPCGAKELDCLQQCENQFPGGAAEYQALIQCVICGECVTLCEHAPDTCK